MNKNVLQNVKRCIALCVVLGLQLFAGNANGQVVWNPSPASGNLWMTAASWTGGSVPGTSAWAQFGSAGTSTTILIQMSAANNNGTNNQAVGAIDMTAARATGTFLQIGAVGANGILTFNGATVSGTSNVILSNSSSVSLNFPTSSPSLRFSVPGTTNRNIVTAGGTSSTLIGSTISMIDTITSSAPFTFLGGGTWNGSSGNAGGLWKITGGGQNFSGGVTVGKSDGTQCGVFEIDAVNTLLNTSGNNVTVNPNSELYLNSATGTFNTSNITLTLNGNGNPVSLTAPGGALVQKSSTSYTWTGPIVLATDATISTINTGTLTLSGNISGSGMLTKNGVTSQNGTILLSGTSNSWSGGTTVATGNIIVASGSSISTGALSMTGATTSIGTTITFNNSAQTISSLSSSFVPTTGTQTQTVSLASGHTLTLNQSSNTTFGVGTVTTQNSIISGAGALVKTGAGRLTLTSNGTYFTGGLTITNGEIRFNPATNSAITFNSPVTLNGGTLSTTSSTSTATITFNTLNLAANSTIDLGTTTTHSVKFAASSGVSWTGSTVLNVTGWQGAFNGTAGTKGRLFIGATSAGASAGQLAQIHFTDGSGNVYPAAILSTGEIVPKATITTTAAGYGPFVNTSSHVISVGFTSNGAFSGNFRVQLSDASGTFTNDTVTNILGTGATSPISATIASGTASGAGYRVRVINGSPYTIYGTDNGSNISILAPNPTVTSVTPNSGIPGSSVTIAGTNFNTTAANNIVYFGATQATVTSASATSLTVTIPTDAIYQPVTVLNTSVNLSGANRLSFTPTYTTTDLTAGQINFSTYQNFATGSSPYIGVMGDLDGDGKSDMVSANAGPSSISVFRNTSAAGSLTAGSFGTASSLTTASTPTNVRLVDIDGDGKLDVVVVCAGATAISVFRNTSSSGSISFASRVDLSTTASGLAPIQVTFADYDGDGRTDLAVSASFSNNIIVFQNASSPGTISFGTGIAFATGSGPFGIRSADFDGDGKVDIAVVDTGAASVAVFRNTSSVGTINSGSFATAVTFSTGTTPVDLEVADIDGDGKIDIVTSNLNANTVSVLRNTSSSGSITSGSFASHTDFSTGTDPSGVAVGDFDGDGNVDIAVANAGSNTVSVLRNTSSSGSISLATKVDFGVGTTPEGISAGDLDGDGKPDIIVAAQSGSALSVLRNFRQPNVAAISGATSVCASANTTLTDATSGGTWSTSDATIASVSTGGVVTGVASGSATISYTVVVSGDTTVTTSPMTVNPATSAGTISGASSVCATSTTTLTSSGPTGGTWSSSNTSVATVDSVSGVVTGISSGSAFINYTVTGTCGTDVSSASMTVNPLPNAGSVSGTSPLCPGGAIIYSSTGTGGGSWSSSDNTIATVAASGLVRAVATGSASISYTVTNTCGTDIATYALTVSPLPDAGTLSGASSVCALATTTITSSGSTGGTWSSSNTAVATVDASGVVTGVTGGSATITYSVTNSCGTDRATQAITVNALPTAGTIIGSTTMCVAATTSMAATGTTGGVWSSSASSIATVNTSGTVYGVSVGSATITYQVTTGCGSDMATQSVTVNGAPSTPASITGTTTITLIGATTTLSDATSGGSWSSSNTSVATVNSSGVVTAVGLGTATITYTVSNTCGSAYTTVGVTVTSSNHAPVFMNTRGVTSVCQDFVGAPISEPLAAMDADSGQTISWAIVTGPLHGTAVVSYSVVSTGRAMRPVGVTYSPAHGYNGGDSMVVSISDGLVTTNATIRFTVNVNPAAPIISGASQVCSGGTTTLTASPTGGYWGSMDGNTTTNPTTGVVTGHGGGNSIIYYNGPYNSFGCRTQARTTINVISTPGQATLTGAGSICPGASITLGASTAGGTWVSSNTSIATVTSGGSVTSAGSPGTATISYTLTNTCGSATSTKQISISGATLPGPIGGTPLICQGTTVSYSDPIVGGTWSLTNTSLATVSAGGIVTGVTPGYDTIIYSYTNGCGLTASVNKTVVVLAQPHAGTISGPSTMVMGTSAAFTTTGSAGGTWSTSFPSIASVGSTGIVRAVAVGIDTIKYKVTNGCGVSIASAVVSVTSSKEQNNGSSDLGTIANVNVYPNPTTGIVTVELTGATGSTGLIVTDVAGKLITAATSESNKFELDFSNLSKGVYLIKISNSGNNYTEKIIVQ